MVDKSKIILMSQEEQFILSRWFYSIAEDFISDSQYSLLLEYITAKGLLPEYTKRSWSSDPCPLELLKKYGYEQYAQDIILSDKTESMPSLRTEKELYDHYAYMDDMHYVMFKYDGFNIQATYHNTEIVYVQTRGRIGEPLDVSHLAERLPKKITLAGKIRIIMEFMVNDKNFEILKQLYPKKELVSQRNAVRTAIAGNHLGLLTPIALNIEYDNAQTENYGYTLILLKQWGFDVPVYRTVNNYQDLVKAVHELSELKPYTELPTDGVVVRRSLGTNLRAVRIFNWEEAIYRSYVIGYEEGIKGHEIPIKLMIRPIRLQNSIQRRIPITNINRVVVNNLTIDSPVAFRLRSDSTAVIDLESTKILQDMFKGRYDYYKLIVDEDESIKEKRNS